MLNTLKLSLLLPLLPLFPPTTALTINTTLLAPWQIPHLSTHSPSGYPANHPYSHLSFTIRDPNTITLGPTHFGDAAFGPTEANCTVWWLSYKPDENPLKTKRMETCYQSSPIMQNKWTFEVLNNGTEPDGGSATTDFRLRVRLEEAVVLGQGGAVNLVWEGEAAFKVGYNDPGANMGGACGGSGVCSWGLRDEYAPVVVRQRLVAVECVIGTCEDQGEE